MFLYVVCKLHTPVKEKREQIVINQEAQYSPCTFFQEAICCCLSLWRCGYGLEITFRSWGGGGGRVVFIFDQGVFGLVCLLGSPR